MIFVIAEGQQHRMGILVLGIGNPPAPFIIRRVLALAQAGVRVTVVVPATNNSHLHAYNLDSEGLFVFVEANVLRAVKYLLRTGVAGHYLFLRDLLGRNLSVRRLLRHTPVYALRGRINLVHWQWIPSARDIQWAKRVLGVPVLITARGSQVHVYPFAYPSRNQELRKSFNAADGIVCVSESIRNICQKIGADRSKLFVVYNGVDIRLFRPSEQRRQDDKLRLISVGALMWRKNFWHVIDVLHMLRERGVPAVLTIIGDGELLHPLRFYAYRLGVLEHVNFKGWCSQEELLQEYWKSDVYVHTSLAEGLANTVLEAQACGLPVVGYEVEGMREAVEEGAGFLVPIGAREQLFRALVTLYQDGDLRRRMGLYAREVMCAKFDASKWTQKAIELYRGYM